MCHKVTNQRINISTYRRSVRRDAADALEVDRLGSTEESMFVDEVLHDLALLPAHRDALVLALVEIVGGYEIWIGDEEGHVVEQVAPACNRDARTTYGDENIRL